MEATELLVAIRGDLSAMREGMAEIREGIAEMSDHLRNLDTLGKRRERNRLQMARHRAAVKSVLTQQSCVNTKEEEGEKRDIPPTPPIERKGEGEEIKTTTTTTTARAREGISVVDMLTTPPTVDEIRAECERISSDIDPEYFAAYYTNRDKWPKDWRKTLYVWTHNMKRGGRLATAAAAKPAKKFTAADWALCAERCKNCNGAGCKRGFLTPPDRDAVHPHAPEECPKFSKI